MSLGAYIAIILRLLVPPLILRYPLGGLVACMALDTFDVTLAAALGGPAPLASDPAAYHLADKVLDTYYLSFAYAVSLKWANRTARGISSFLFWERLAGIVLFFATGSRVWLLVFPNVFEYFFFLYVMTGRFVPRLRPQKPRHLVALVLIAGLPQVFREYLYHYVQLSLVDIVNTFTPLEIKEPSLWEWFKNTFW